MNFPQPITPQDEKTLWTTTPSIWMYGNRLGLAILLAPVGIGLIYGAWLWLSARCTKYRLTSERLIWGRGVLNRRQDQVELYRVRDVTVLQPLALRVMGLGNVVIMSSDITTPNDALLAVKQPLAVQELVRAAVEAVRDRRGIRALDIETR